ncbi:RrF2 family transcriptional regulator [Caminibacter profundus]
MLFTKSTAYALQALIELSKFDKPVDVNKISELTDLPKPFLAKLLQNLSKKGFVRSFKGIHGGFILAKKPEEIKIADVFRVLEDKESFIFYCSSNKKDCTRDRSHVCSLWPFFAKVEKEVSKILEEYTLADVIRMRTVK